MAGDDQRDGIAGQGVADGASGTGSAYLHSQLAVGDGPPRANLPTSGENRSVEITLAREVNLRISTEIEVLALKVGDDPLLERCQQALVDRHIVERDIQAGQQGRPYLGTIRSRKAGLTDSIARASQAEVTPAGFEDRMSDGINVHLHCPTPRNNVPYGRNSLTERQNPAKEKSFIEPGPASEGMIGS